MPRNGGSHEGFPGDGAHITGAASRCHLKILAAFFFGLIGMALKIGALVIFLVYFGAEDSSGEKEGRVGKTPPAGRSSSPRWAEKRAPRSVYRGACFVVAGAG